YARRRLDDDTALDVSSQAMQTIWSKDLAAPRTEIESRQLQSLAYRIVEGHIRNALRSRGRFGRIVLAVAETQRLEPNQISDIADLVVEGDAVEWLEKLSVTDREVLALVMDGYAVSEIALILDCTPAAVSMRLQRAKRNLRLLLGRGTQHG
ncbi:MAG: sigma-70 family RNA polymerase sigma factor, partial [Aeromicrobium sp.]